MVYPPTALKFGLAFRKRRRELDLTQLTVAMRLGWSHSFVSLLEKGVLPARAESLVLYARLLQMAPAEIDAMLNEALPLYHSTGRELDRQVTHTGAAQTGDCAQGAA